MPEIWHNNVLSSDTALIDRLNSFYIRKWKGELPSKWYPEHLSLIILHSLVQGCVSVSVCVCVCLCCWCWAISSVWWLLCFIFGEGNGTPLQYSRLENPMEGGAWWAAVHGVARSQTRLSDFTFTFHFHVLEKEMATHSSVLAWRIPGTGEPGELLSLGSHRVGHDWSDLALALLYIHCEVESLCYYTTRKMSINTFRVHVQNPWTDSD